MEQQEIVNALMAPLGICGHFKAGLIKYVWEDKEDEPVGVTIACTDKQTIAKLLEVCAEYDKEIAELSAEPITSE